MKRARLVTVENRGQILAFDTRLTSELAESRVLGKSPPRSCGDQSSIIRSNISTAGFQRFSIFLFQFPFAYLPVSGVMKYFAKSGLPSVIR
jgi:hypothetical protein